KNAYRGFQEVRRADTPNQGLSGRQEPRQPPAKPICTALAAIQLVGGRRPSMLQRWGSGVLPRRFPVALKALPEPWQLRRFGDYRAKVANDVILRRLPYPASHRTDMRQKSNAGCANVIPSPATIFRLPSGQGFTPTPRISAYVLNVVSGSLPLPRPLAH
ncbi:hypothetical protein ACNQDT_005366, partial [Escherichia coli]